MAGRRLSSAALLLRARSSRSWPSSTAATSAQASSFASASPSASASNSARRSARILRRPSCSTPSGIGSAWGLSATACRARAPWSLSRAARSAQALRAQLSHAPCTSMAPPAFSCSTTAVSMRTRMSPLTTCPFTAFGPAARASPRSAPCARRTPARNSGRSPASSTCGSRCSASSSTAGRTKAAQPRCGKPSMIWDRTSRPICERCGLSADRCCGWSSRSRYSSG
mmetsp:Transcript_41434/g.118828  ORF Transcript_41434/g.118828 Transcript_41434/m.118828 type:complete len:226 (+) Transcript_41434:152-829(+)